MRFHILEKSEWKKREREHRRLVKQWTEPFRQRRQSRSSHPVHDFLFVYYRYSPAKLEQWHPGFQTLLESPGPHDFQSEEYTRTPQGLICDPAQMSLKVRNRLRWTANLLRATENQRPNYSCLGLHEWAMVYRGQEIRHESTTRLRLPQSEIDQIVESRPLTCTHFDAFRFFAKDAMPLNKHQPTLESRPTLEQPACIHANMDLYKWAFKSMPWIGSDLLIRCFNFAMQARAIDMRASPYDLSEYGDYEPIKIETAVGRLEYEQAQRLLSEQAAPLRDELATQLESLLELVPIGKA